MDSARLFAAAALNAADKLDVISEILNWHNTEGMRQVMNDAMDIRAGRAVCGGPRNYLRGTDNIAPVGNDYRRLTHPVASTGDIH